jgi:hypothetical protein
MPPTRLREQKRVDDVKTIKDKAEAMRAYARQIKNPQLEADAWEIRKRAEDRLGELTAALDVGRGTQLPANGKLKREELKQAGISTSAASRYEQFNKLPAKEKEARIAKGRAAIEAGKSIAVTPVANFATLRVSGPRRCAFAGLQDFRDARPRSLHFGMLASPSQGKLVGAQPATQETYFQRIPKVPKAK